MPKRKRAASTQNHNTHTNKRSRTKKKPAALSDKIILSKKEKHCRIMFASIFLVLTVYIILPVFDHMINYGMAFTLVTGAGFLLSVSPKLHTLVFKKSKVVSRIVTTAIVIFTVVIAGTLSVIIIGGNRPVKDSNTMIILGCQVIDETPSLMLQKRVAVALEYAKQNPDCRIIASGGCGSGENISEAECIKRMLIAAGISSERIYIDEHSLNTKQNLEYSAEIIEREGLDKDVIIVTNRFHQFRASFFASKYGLTTSPLSSNLKFSLVPAYWLREVFAVLRALLFGY